MDKSKGTFWVIDGLKIKKKRPFVIVIVDRKGVVKKASKKNVQVMLNNNQQDFERRFFQEEPKMANQCMLRFSSLSSLREQHLFQQGSQLFYNFSLYSHQPNNQQLVSNQDHHLIFPNQFIPFVYPNDIQ